MKSAFYEECFSRCISVSRRAESFCHADCTVHPAGTKAEGVGNSEEERENFLSPQIIDSLLLEAA